MSLADWAMAVHRDGVWDATGGAPVKTLQGRVHDCDAFPRVPVFEEWVALQGMNLQSAVRGTTRGSYIIEAPISQHTQHWWTNADRRDALRVLEWAQDIRLLYVRVASRDVELARTFTAIAVGSRVDRRHTLTLIAAVTWRTYFRERSREALEADLRALKAPLLRGPLRPL